MATQHNLPSANPVSPRITRDEKASTSTPTTQSQSQHPRQNPGHIATPIASIPTIPQLPRLPGSTPVAQSPNVTPNITPVPSPSTRIQPALSSGVATPSMPTQSNPMAQPGGAPGQHLPKQAKPPTLPLAPTPQQHHLQPQTHHQQQQGVPAVTPVANPGTPLNVVPTPAESASGVVQRTPEMHATEIEFKLNILRNRVKQLTTNTPQAAAKAACAEAVALLQQVENEIEAFRAQHPSIAAFLPTDGELRQRELVEDDPAVSGGANLSATPKPAGSNTPSSSKLPESTQLRVTHALEELSALRKQLRLLTLRVHVPAPTPYQQHHFPLPHPVQSATNAPGASDVSQATVSVVETKVADQPMSRNYNALSRDIDQSTRVIESLSRTRASLVDVIDQSARAHTTLLSSTETAQSVLKEAESARNALNSSKSLVKKLESKSKIEQRMVYAAFLFFVATAAYIILKRFLPIFRPVGWVASSIYDAASYAMPAVSDGLANVTDAAALNMALGSELPDLTAEQQQDLLQGQPIQASWTNQDKASDAQHQTQHGSAQAIPSQPQQRQLQPPQQLRAQPVPPHIQQQIQQQQLQYQQQLQMQRLAQQQMQQRHHHQQQQHPYQPHHYAQYQSHHHQHHHHPHHHHRQQQVYYPQRSEL